MILTIVFLLNFQNATFAQEIQQKKWIVKLNATALLDGFSFPTVQFAVERKLGSYFSAQTEAGIQAYNLNRNRADTLSVNTSGFRIMAEGRFYPFKYLKNDKAKARKSDGLYTGLQFFYRKNSYNERKYYYLSESDYDNAINKMADDFGIKKEVYGINLCLGYQLPFKNFIMEPYMYLGFMERTTKNLNREYDKNLGHISAGPTHPAIYIRDLKEESGTTENFSCGVRIGYKF